jgi:hypothetical protein
MIWYLRDLLGQTPVTLAYRCDTHPETGWIQFEDWRRHLSQL